MSIEVLNESGHDLDVKQLAALSRFVMDRMRVHPQAELCIKAVDESTIAELNEQWMEKEGPTDVLAFPMSDRSVPKAANSVVGPDRHSAMGHEESMPGGDEGAKAWITW